MLVSGATKTMRRMLPHPNLGVLLTPDVAYKSHLDLIKGVPWAADNSAFMNFDPASYCTFLGKIARLPGCLFVAVPDVVTDAPTTLTRFDRWQPVLAEIGLPVAYVAQDGAEDLDLPWGRMTALFVGGSTAWKESRAAADLCGEAKRRRRWVHVGRVNTRRRIHMIRSWGTDSFDGTGFSRWSDIQIPNGLRWIQEDE